jgi:hypothetical protein
MAVDFRGSVALVLFAALSAARSVAAANAVPTPQADAPIDLTGYWVAIVNEDWRWRMLKPPKGDYASVPLNAAGKAAADRWDPSTDGSCKAFGAAGLMRMPTRLHISWASSSVLRIESDAGSQTRYLYFDAAQMPPGTAGTLQGRSVATWEHSLPFDTGGYGGAPSRNGGIGGAPTNPPKPRPGGDLKVETRDLAAGWLRRNGVPYSADTRVTEYFDRFPTPDGHEWFVVTTQVDDPTYLRAPFVTSSHFRREPDGSKWRPAACSG